MADSPIKLANEQMTIFEACREVGMGEIPGGMKTYCPFGNEFHSDGGRTRSFKIFPESNSAYCWACPQYFTPVKLIAMDGELTDLEAANKILELKEYVAPDFVSRWEELKRLEEAPRTDHDALSEALILACARMAPGTWEKLQYDPKVAKKLTECLSLVRKIKDEEQARAWFAVAKEAMRNILASVAKPSPTT